MIPTWKTARIRPSSTCSSSPAPSAPPWKIARVRPSSSASFPSVPTVPPWQTPRVQHPTLASSPSLPSPPPFPDSPSHSLGFQCPGSPPANFQPPGSPPVIFQSPKSPTVSFPPPQTGKGSAHVQRVLPVIEYVHINCVQFTANILYFRGQLRLHRYDRVLSTLDSEFPGFAPHLHQFILKK